MLTLVPILQNPEAAPRSLGQKPRDISVNITDTVDFELFTFMVVFTHP